MTHVLILGSTGSIGRQALEVLPCIPGLHLAGLAAHANVDLVLEQAAQTGARVVCLQDAGAAAATGGRLPGNGAGGAVCAPLPRSSAMFSA